MSANAIIPGTTFTVPIEANGHASAEAPKSQPGPIVNSKQTTITLFSASQFAQSGTLSSFKNVANDAFRQGHDSSSVLPSNIDRITSEQYLLNEVGSVPGTFTYIIRYRDNDTDVVATATMWRFTDVPVLEAITPDQLEKARRNQIFKRVNPLPPGVDGWELKLMFVNPNAQRQGLASMLMDLCETEARRRIAAATRTDDSVSEVRFVLTTIEETNGEFYRKRGFTLDSRKTHPPGTMESPNGFTIAHMSKVIGIDVR